MTFEKYGTSPVFGNAETGTVFDGYIWMDGGRYRMDFSWRPKKACAVTFSDDGIHWSEPVITLANDLETGWEDDLNRNCVLKVGDVYKMWYTGQARGYSYIGYAESSDGIHFERRSAEPIMIPELPFERAAAEQYASGRLLADLSPEWRGRFTALRDALRAEYARVKEADHA